MTNRKTGLTAGTKEMTKVNISETVKITGKIDKTEQKDQFGLERYYRDRDETL